MTIKNKLRDYSLVIKSPDIIDATILSVVNNKWATLIGDAGIGKTNYINEIVEQLSTYPPSGLAGNNWKIIQLTLGLNPINNIAKAFAKPNSLLPAKSLQPDIEQDIIDILNKNNQGLRKVFEFINSKTLESFNILIIIDDFEDVIRYQKLREERMDIDFISLLVSAVNNIGLPIYLLTSMPPVYVYESMKYRGLTKILNQGKITIPSISTEDVVKELKYHLDDEDGIYPQETILFLLNQIENDKEPESLLFRVNFLLRYFKQIGYANSKTNPILDVKYGIDKYLTQRLNLLPDNLKSPFIFLIKQIVNHNANNRLERNPISIDQATSILKEQFPEINNEEVVLKIIEHFQTPELKLFHPAEGNSFPMIDLYNDALLSSWHTLFDWIEEETTSINIYKRLISETFLYKNGVGEGELYSGQKLLAALNWVEDVNPTSNWANRLDTLKFTMEDKNTWAKDYLSPYDAVIDFINNSKNKYQKKRNQENAIKQIELKKANRRALILAGLFLLSLASLVFGFITLNNLKEKNKREELFSTIENLRKAQLLIPETSVNQPKFDDIKNHIKKDNINNEEELFQKLQEYSLFLMEYKPDDKIYLESLSLINKYYDIQTGKHSFSADKRKEELEALDRLYYDNKNNKGNNSYVHIVMSKYRRILLKTNHQNNYLSINYDKSIYDIASNPVIEDEFAFGDEEGNVVICDNLFDNLTYIKGEYAIRSLEYSPSLNNKISDKEYQYIFAGSQSGELLRWEWSLKNNTKIDSYNIIRASQYPLLKVTQPINQLQFFKSSSLGNVLAVGTPNKVLLIDVEKKNKILRTINSGETIVSWSIAPEGDYIFYSTPTHSYLQKINSKSRNKTIKIITPKSMTITASAINNIIGDSRQIVLGTNNGLILHGNLYEVLNDKYFNKNREIDLEDLVSDNLDTIVARHNAAISRLVYNPYKNSFQLASASLDGTVRIIDSLPQDEENDIRLIANNRDIWTLDFKNNFEIVAGENRAMKMWISNTDTLHNRIEK